MGQVSPCRTQWQQVELPGTSSVINPVCFRCLSLAVSITKDRHHELREWVVEVQKKNKNTNSKHKSEDFNLHVDHMSKSDERTTSWVTVAEISATSECLRRQIYSQRV